MAITNYSELKTSVESWLSRTSPTLLALIPDFITLAEGNLNRVLEVREMEASDTLTPSSGVCALPSDYLRLRRLYINRADKLELQYLAPEQFYNEYPVPVAGSRFYTIEGNNIVLADNSDGNDVKILYYKTIPALSDSNTTNWLLTKHADLYLAATLAGAYDVAKNQPEHQKWYAKAGAIVNEITELDKRSKYSGSALRVTAS